MRTFLSSPLYPSSPLHVFPNLLSYLLSLFSNSETFATSIPSLFDHLLFISIHFILSVPFPFFRILCSSNSSTLVAFPQSMLETDYGTLEELYDLKRNVVVFLALVINAVPTKVVTTNLCMSVEDPDSNLERTKHSYPWPLTRVLTTLAFVVLILGMLGDLRRTFTHWKAIVSFRIAPSTYTAGLYTWDSHMGISVEYQEPASSSPAVTEASKSNHLPFHSMTDAG